MYVGDSNAEQKVHEYQNQSDNKNDEKYFGSQSCLATLDEGVSEVQLPHQHGENLHEGGVQLAEVVRLWHESVEHQTEGQEDDPECDEKFYHGDRHSLYHEDLESECWKS